MGKSIVKYKHQGQVVWGLKKGQNIISLIKQPDSLSDLITHQSQFLKAENLSKDFVAYDQIEIFAPVSKPLRVICQGVNYASHRAESALSKSSSGNVIFAKDYSAVSGAYSPINRPKDCLCLDYEVELGLIIKQDITEATQITDGDLHQYIAGLVLANDMSPRDLQYKEDYGQWFKGKSCRTMLPLGPILYLLDKEDFAYLDNLNLKLWVNGQLRQDANTSQLIFRPAETLREISEFMDLSVGDLLLTGTPGGVVIKAPSKFLQGIATWLMSNEQKVAALQQKQAEYLQDGDTIEASISSPDGQIDLGRQTNTIVPYEDH
ncbi:MAG: fumarylacetoacetate hydrolase family protein [Bacteroidota bacterium]